MAGLGNMLFEARKRAGYTLHEISRGTNIRLSLLQKLEAGDYDGLPSSGYVRGFINSYARFVDVDPTPFLEQYAREAGISAFQQQLDLVQKDEVVKARDFQHMINWRVALTGLAIILIIAFTVWAVTSLFTTKTQLPPPPTTSIEETQTDNSPPENEEVDTIPYTLVVSVVEGAATEVDISVDGVEAFKGVLTSENRLEYVVAKTARITVVSPAKIRVTKDGNRVALPDKENVSVDIDAAKR